MQRHRQQDQETEFAETHPKKKRKETEKQNRETWGLGGLPRFLSGLSS